MRRLYFNRWFSTVYHYMDLIRANPDGRQFEIYATHPNPHHASLQAADVAGQEPQFIGQEYAEYCLEHCIFNGIDCFIPKYQMVEIAKLRHRFEQHGIQLMMAAELETLLKMEQKHLLFDDLLDDSLVAIPDYELVSTAEQFAAACHKLMNSGKQVCFKPTQADGGMGFRIIGENRDKYAELLGYVTPYVEVDDVVSILAEKEKIDELLVMEFIEGTEYTVDCLADRDGNLLAAVPRRKGDQRTRVLENNLDLLQLASRFAQKYRLAYNYNIQVMLRDGIYYLIEVNPRMSGGLHVSCLSGVNFPYLAVCLAFGVDVNVPTPQLDIVAGTIEKEIILKGFDENE